MAGMRVDEGEGLEACGASWKVAKVHGAPRNGPMPAWGAR